MGGTGSATREGGYTGAGSGRRRLLNAVVLIAVGAAIMLLGANVTVQALTGFLADIVGQDRSPVPDISVLAAFFRRTAAIAFHGPFVAVWGAIGFAVLVGGVALILHAISLLTESRLDDDPGTHTADDGNDGASLVGTAHAPIAPLR